MKRFSLIFAVAALGMLFTASSALADHARPKGASPLNFRLVPAFAQCSGSVPPGMTHGPPLAVPSCSPPDERSNYLTLNAPDRPAPYNTVADGTGLITLAVTCLVPGTTTQITGAGGVPPCSPAGEQEDVKVTSVTTGVRCQGVSGGCAAAGGLYSGKVLGTTLIRITDHFNAISPNPPGADCSDTTSCVATSIDLPFSVGVQCSAGACNTVTSANLTVPGAVKELKRAVVGLGQIEVADAGADGDLAGAYLPAHVRAERCGSQRGRSPRDCSSRNATKKQGLVTKGRRRETASGLSVSRDRSVIRFDQPVVIRLDLSARNHEELEKDHRLDVCRDCRCPADRRLWRRRQAGGEVARRHQSRQSELPRRRGRVSVRRPGSAHGPVLQRVIPRAGAGPLALALRRRHDERGAESRPHLPQAGLLPGADGGA